MLAHAYPMSSIIEPGVMILYLFVSSQAFLHAHSRNHGEAKSALYSLGMIFLFCGITRVLHYVSIPPGPMSIVSVGLHIFLLGAIARFAALRQVDDLAKILWERDKRGEKSGRDERN
jgi:hypothetical protein